MKLMYSIRTLGVGLKTTAIIAVALAGSASGSPELAKPCDIVRSVSQHVIQRVDYSDPASLEEVLDFIRSTYDIEIAPPRPTTFSFEYRLSDSILARPVTLVARKITMIEAIKEVLGDLPVSLAFEKGKLVFVESGDQPGPDRENINGEQAGSGQPATRRESKSEGGDKPQPEAEGRPR